MPEDAYLVRLYEHFTPIGTALDGFGMQLKTAAGEF